METIYADLKSTSETLACTVSVPSEGRGCGLMEIRGRVWPHSNEPMFLCCDFIVTSLVGSHSKRLPILRRIYFEEGPASWGVINKTYGKMLWLSTNRFPLKELRVYLTDVRGNPAPFQKCQLNCTLVIIPHKNK